MAIVGIRDQIKGQVPLGLFVLNDECTKIESEIEVEVIAMVRATLGPVAFFKSAVQVTGLPKTRSGKILRTPIRSIANGDDYKVPATIESMDVVHEITGVIKSHGEHLHANALKKYSFYPIVCERLNHLLPIRERLIHLLFRPSTPYGRKG